MNRLKQYKYFCGIQSTYIASQVVEMFMREIHRLNGFPKVIASDKHPKFIGKFWREL